MIVPTGAVRDEGTSYHYAPADVAVAPHPRALAAIDDVLTEAGVPHDRGLTWTTDAFFRETPAKVARRREQGCITVEMEAAAMFAAAAFRGVVYGQLLYAGDDVSADEWDHRALGAADVGARPPARPRPRRRHPPVAQLEGVLRLHRTTKSFAGPAQLEVVAGGQVVALAVTRPTDPQHQLAARGAS